MVPVVWVYTAGVHQHGELVYCFARIAVAENNMNVSSMALPFEYVEGMSAKDYVAAICNSTGVQLCTVPSNGA